MKKPDSKTKYYNRSKKQSNMAAVYKKRDEMPECMVLDCEGSTHGGARGLCYWHYKDRKNRVNRKEETWDSLIEKGLCNKIRAKKKKIVSKAPKKRKKSPYDFS